MAGMAMESLGDLLGMVYRFDVRYLATTRLCSFKTPKANSRGEVPPGVFIRRARVSRSISLTLTITRRDVAGSSAAISAPIAMLHGWPLLPRRSQAKWASFSSTEHDRLPLYEV